MTRIIPVTGRSATLEREVANAVASQIAGKDIDARFDGGTGLYLPYTHLPHTRKKRSKLVTSILTLAAMAMLSPSAARGEDGVTLFGASRSTELYDAIHGVRSASLVSESDGVSAIIERNRGEFDGGNDYAAITKRFKAGEWTLTPGLRLITTDEQHRMNGSSNITEFLLIAKRTNAIGTLNLCTAYRDNNTMTARTWGNIGPFQGGIGAKVMSLSGNGPTIVDAFGGIAYPEAGVFLAKSTLGPIAANGYAQVPLGNGNIGAYAIYKDFPGQKDWGLLWTGIYGANDKMSQMFTADTGVFTSRAVTDQVARPFMGPLDSVFSVGAPVAIELARVRDAEKLFVQGTIGARLPSPGNGIELYAGPSVQWRTENGVTSVHYGGEGRLVVPVKRVGTLALDYRQMSGPGANRQLAASLTVNY